MSLTHCAERFGRCQKREVSVILEAVSEVTGRSCREVPGLNLDPGIYYRESLRGFYSVPTVRFRDSTLH
jgi:hypothetical protein